ncbi:hypothetical protein RHMOL_Rhmol01G0325700 [Rhododendron molle]|uniref:Uncharacterized protein n=1 Tax=Rhododendron molle TaxID=49168 RepID=A0ACC0QA24_RHOML|nr:hypothetical protein RHMOL_Rhmol01G0325700 [Rhododendron molle]
METAGAREEVENILSSRTEEISGPLRLSPHDSSSTMIAQMTKYGGGEKKSINTSAQYYVEEPDSPRELSTAQNLGLTEVLRPALPLGLKHGLGSLGVGEEGLAKAFSSALILKRKTSESPEREDKGKKQKITLYEEDGDCGQRMAIEGDELNGHLQKTLSHNRARPSRGRGRRGGKSLSGLAKRKSKSPNFTEDDLVDVEVNCGDNLVVGYVQDESDDRRAVDGLFGENSDDCLAHLEVSK